MRTRDGPGATPSQEMGARTLGHADTCACLIFYLDLKLVRGGTRSSGYRQWPPGPPRERL
jgi:hypothetical protein